MKLKALLLGLVLTTSSVFAADTREEVLETLNLIQGCFEVTYQFVEDGETDKIYAPIYEWIRIKEDENDFILEHIGQYPERDEEGNQALDENGDPIYFLQYHWREHWAETEEGKWKTWTYGPYAGSEMRYECEAKWQKGQFHCHTEAAKPRRHRNRDYDYLFRINNLQVNGKRWIHGQRNKMMMNDGTLVSTEMGWNTYERVEDSVCQPAIDAHPEPLVRD